MRLLASLLLAALACQPLLGDTPSDENEKSTSVWMQKKMDYAQSILRGLSAADFQTIETNARQMRLLNKVEGFVRRGNPDYRVQLRTFERVCDEMIEQASDENLPGVTLAFNQLTVSCVNCHATLRSPQRSDGSK